MFARFTNQSQAQRILLIKFGTSRDIVRLLPFVNIIRMRFPYAKITWLATPEMVDFLNHYNIADRIIIAKPLWHKNLCEAKALEKRLRNFEPDICFDLQDNLASKFAAKLSGARKCLTHHGDQRRIFKRSNGLGCEKNRLSQRLSLLETFDVVGTSIDYDLPIIPAESRTVDWIVHELGLHSTPFAIVGVGVQSGPTYWQTNRYAQVARHLNNVLEMPTVVAWGNEQERQVAENVVADSGNTVLLAPAMSATQFAALARCADIYVGVDNDFLHIAAAVGTPTIGVFCNAESYRDVPCCRNFQCVPAQTTEHHRNNRGRLVETFPVQVDNYTYDVIKVCNACDEILRPETETRLPKQRRVSVVGA